VKLRMIHFLPLSGGVRETVVFKVVVGNAYGVPIPIVGQGFDNVVRSVQGGQRSFLVYPYRKGR